jgi:hypothetical protein
MNGLSDFVAGGFPLPWTPVYDGMGEFVGGGFPLPQNPVYFPSAQGSLPKAPDMPRALIGNGLGRSDMIRGFSGMGERSDMIRGFSGMGERSDMIRGFSGMGERSDMIRGFSGVGDCGCGGSCGGCGMGDWTSSLPTFLQGSVTLPAVGSVPTVYLAGGVLLAAFLFMGSKKGRR